MYPEILEFAHRDGHLFPHSEPRASEIYAHIAEEICQRCGKNDVFWVGFDGDLVVTSGD